MVKPIAFEPKQGRGIGLRPALWKRIARFAEQQQKTMNTVIEQTLDTYIPDVPDSTNSREASNGTGIPWKADES